MKIFTVTVNFNCSHLLERHLKSIASQTRAVESIVVDNASDDNSCRLISDQFSQNRLIQANTNFGYGAAANLGIKEATAQGADFVLVLNPDVFPEPDYIEKMLVHMQASPQTAICGGRLYREPRNGQKILDSTGLFLRWNFFARDRDAGATDTGQNITQEKIFALCGSALFIRLSAFTDEVFDSSIFMYGEDVELCWRAQSLGFDVVYLPAAAATHIRGGTGRAHRFRNQSTKQKAQTLKSRYIYLLKHLRPAPWQLLRLALAELEVLAIMLTNPKLFKVWADIWKIRRKTRSKNRSR